MNPHHGKLSRPAAIALAVVGLLVIILVWRARQPQVGGVPFAQLPAAEQETRRAELKTLEEQARDVAAKAGRHEKSSFTITMSEAQLNTALHERLTDPKSPVKDLRAGLSPGQIILQGNADAGGFSGPATLTGTLETANGAVSFKAQSLSVRGFPVPGSIREKVQEEINKNLGRVFAETSAKVSSVTIGAGSLTIAGTTE